MNRALAGTLAAGVFVGCAVAANVATARYGFVPVGFGLEATAGTFFAGLALTVRDFLQDTAGRVPVIVLIVAAAGLSAIGAPVALAVASGAAFLVSELLDLAVYTPLRAKASVGDHRWAAAVAASNLVGAVVDTAVFLGLAFGAAAIWPGLPGQLVGKLEVTAVVVAATVLARQGIRSRATPGRA